MSAADSRGRTLSSAAASTAGRRPDVAAAELTEAELRAWGRRLGEGAARRCVFVALYGPLGAGKTTLVRAAVEGAGAVEPALSPTFTLVHEHRAGELTLGHVDLYRIEGPDELDELGWDDLVAGDAPVFVEWAERAGHRLPPDRWEVRLGPGSSPSTRRVEVTRRGEGPEPPALPDEMTSGTGAGGERR